jgi:predicted negative regulator of RcsB-dependent stress response
MKNFIEVGKTDEEQAEQIKKWIKENALQIIMGVSLGLGGLWGFDYYKQQQHQGAMQARVHYLSVVANPGNTDALKALKENHAQSTYAQQADLIMAKQAANQGNYQDALNYLLPLTNSTNEFIAQNAKFRAVNVYLEINDADKALDILGDNTNKAFSALHDNIKGDIYFAQNNIKAAKEHYQLAISQLGEDSKLMPLIQIKLNDLN